MRSKVAKDEEERDVIVQRAIQRALLKRQRVVASSSVCSIAHDILLGCVLAACIVLPVLVMATLHSEYQGLAVEHARDSLREVASLMLATVCNPFFIVFVICATASYLAMRHFGIKSAFITNLVSVCATASVRWLHSCSPRYATHSSSSS